MSGRPLVNAHGACQSSVCLCWIPFLRRTDHEEDSTIVGGVFGVDGSGGFMAFLTQTNGGTVRVKDVRFVGPGGIAQNARLYVPDGVTSENPAPGIVAIHGYINTHETQAGFAIEFARRGYVVLAVDQTGHGFSDPPSGSNGFGGPPALAFLRTLDIVDPDNIGLEGHSMGGWAILAAAAAYPDGYRSIVLEGSSVGAARGRRTRHGADPPECCGGLLPVR